MADSSAAGIDTSYLQSVFETGQHSDFVIECADRSWKVHQLVICSKSDYFKKACESSFKEGMERKITLLEDKASSVYRMLSWCYGQGYYTQSDGNAAERAVVDVSLHALADKYLMEGLKTECRRQIWKNFLKALPLVAKDGAHLFFLIEAIEAAYTMPQESIVGIRDSVMHGLRDAYSILHPLEEFQQLLRSDLADGDFVRDIMKCWVESAGRKICVCKVCGQKYEDPRNRNQVGIKCSECDTRMGLYLNNPAY